MIVWLASYPRSGNTFQRIFLNRVFGVATHSLYNDRHDIASDAETAAMVGHRSFRFGADIELLRNSRKTWYLKTHEWRDDRVHPEDRVIFLVRDGRDTLVSYRRYLGNYTGAEKSLTEMILGHTHFGGWGGHTRSWDPANRENTLFIRFEELVARPEEFIEPVASFIRRAPLSSGIPAFRELQQVNPKFFARGTSGSGAESFTDKETRLFWHACGQAMEMCGYGAPPIPVDAKLQERLQAEDDAMHARRMAERRNASGAVKGMVRAAVWTARRLFCGHYLKRRPGQGS